MFGTYFKSSIKALPWLILVPVISYILYVFIFDPYYVQIYTIGVKESVGESWYDAGPAFMLRSMIIAIIANFFFLMIIPSGLGGVDSDAKKKEFYTGFFINLILALGLPIVSFIEFGLDGATFGFLIGFHALYFLASFTAGALFVAPAYAGAFWFTDRN
jgi:hypothetical protein